MGRMYTASGTTSSFSDSGDVFEIAAPSDACVIIHSFEIGNSTDAGNAEAEMLECYYNRASTSGSGGSSVTPTKHESGDAAFGGTIEEFNTIDATLESGPGGGLVFNLQAGAVYLPTPEERWVISPGDIFVVGLSDPDDAIGLGWRCTFEEIGG